MSKKIPQHKSKKLSKKKDRTPKNKKSLHMDGGSASTKCKFCGKWVPLAAAWYHPNCGGYQERFDSAMDTVNNVLRVEQKEEVIEEAVEDGES